MLFLTIYYCPFFCFQVKLRHADQEIRLAQEPFPLYPGEVLKQVVTQLKVVPANTALRLRAVLDFQEDDGTKRVAGDEWLFEGPGGHVCVCIMSQCVIDVCVHVHVHLILGKLCMGGWGEGRGCDMGLVNFKTDSLSPSPSLFLFLSLPPLSLSLSLSLSLFLYCILTSCKDSYLASVLKNS